VPVCCLPHTCLPTHLCEQVGSPGEELSAQYLLEEAEKLVQLAADTRPDLRVEAARESVGGVGWDGVGFVSAG